MGGDAHGGARGAPRQREVGWGWGGRTGRQQKGGPFPGRARGEFLRKPRRTGRKTPTHHQGNLSQKGPEHLKASGFQLEGTGKSQRQQGMGV